MKITGIVVEYNPFHYGHLYHIEQARKITHCDVLIAVMSGNFTQRGDPAVADKWQRCQAALENGVDLIVELPFGYACQSADYFAYGAITLLSALGVDHLVFGSESNDVYRMQQITSVLMHHEEEYNSIVQEKMKEGFRYPNACNEALKQITSESVVLPNDLLGYSYIKTIMENHYAITPVSIQRTNDYHSHDLEEIASASAIRNSLANKEDVSDYTPMHIDHPIFLEDYYSLFYYKVVMSETLSQYHLVEEGIEHLFKKNIQLSHSMADFIDKCTSKRYTSSRIKRIILSILLNHTKEEHQQLSLDYIRILGMNSIGQQYLRQVKKTCPIPIISNYKPDYSPLLDLELRSSKLYYMAYPIKIRQAGYEQEYKRFPILYKKEETQ